MDGLDFFDVVWQLIKDFQTGFGYYTLVYFALRAYKGKLRLRGFDCCATVAICSASVLVFVVWTTGVATYWHEDQTAFYNRAAGPYAFAYWLPPLMYTLLPQLLWVQKIRENIATRLLIAFLLFFNFEKFVILVTSLHRDYLPGSWSMDGDSYLPYIAYGILWKLGFFCAATALLYSMRRKKDNFAS